MTMAQNSAPVGAQDLEHVLKNSGYFELETGTISTEQFYSSLSKLTGYTGTLEHLDLIFCDIFSPMPDREKLLHELAGKFKLAAISNTNAPHIAFVERHFKVLDAFHEKIYSFDVRSRKPDRAIYEAALSKMGVTAAESVFIDDRIENCEAARALGFQHVFDVQPNEDLREQFVSCGLLE